jgi:hypothetical protein
MNLLKLIVKEDLWYNQGLILKKIQLNLLGNMMKAMRKIKVKVIIKISLKWHLELNK